MDYKRLIEDCEDRFLPFRDEYFKGLTFEQIAELAKKSIRVTSDNRRLEDNIEDLNEKIEMLTDKYNSTVKQYNALLKHLEHVRELAAKNASAYEYCLKGLEDKVDGLTKQNAILKERLKNVKDVGFWDKDGNYKEDLQEIKEHEI